MNSLTSKALIGELLSELSTTVELSRPADNSKPQRNYLANLIKLGLMGASLLTLPLSGYSAISATTSQTIQGTEPYFTWNNTKITDFNDLLKVRYIDTSGARAIATPPTTGTTATIAVGAAMKENDIETLISGDWSFLSSGTSTPLALSSSIGTAGGALRVGDGDGDAATGASGTITATLFKDGQAIAPTGSLLSADVCATYQLELKVVPPTGGTINATTAFGDPKVSSAYPAQTVTYTLQPPPFDGTTTVQFAKPNLINGTGMPEWSVGNGFILQDVTIPASNFPTMGFNGAFFDVKLDKPVACLITGTKDAGGNEEVSITVEPKPSTTTNDEVRVMLVGPKHNALPSGAYNATIFRLKLGDSDIYTFEIGKWFIAKPSIGDDGVPWSSGNQIGLPPADSLGEYETPRYCFGFGYDVPSINDYTNSNGNGWSGGLVGQGNSYKRAIGGGLFAEWGNTNNDHYIGSDFGRSYYWAIESIGSRQMYASASHGGVDSYTPSSVAPRVACVSP